MSVVRQATPNTNYTKYSPLQRLDRLPRDLHPHAQRLDPSLLHLFQRTRGPNVRIRRVPGPELPGAVGGPAALGVVSGARVAACAGGEDGGFAGGEGGGGDVEDEFEAGEGGHCFGGKGWRFVSEVGGW